MRAKFLIIPIAILFLATGLYLLASCVLTYFPIHPANKTIGSIKIFVVSNGFHTDFLVPVKSRQIDWIKKIGVPNLGKFQNYSYVSFGWGDRDFYLESFSSDYPSLSTILKALFFPTDTLVHVDFWRTVSVRKEYSVELQISEEQYEKLIEYIIDSIRWEKSGIARIFLEHGYTHADLFLEANGYYHLFHTCNNWTNIGLKKIQVTTPVWCPFAYCILEPITK